MNFFIYKNTIFILLYTNLTLNHSRNKAMSNSSPYADQAQIKLFPSLQTMTYE